MFALETEPDDEANKQPDAQCHTDNDADNCAFADAI